VAHRGAMCFPGNVEVDAAKVNKGSWYPGLTFGGGGETIVSNRNSGTNAFGLDFFTGYIPRLSVTNSGLVGIGTPLPGATLGVVAVNSEHPGISASGFNQASGSGFSGTDAIEAFGGNGDPTTGVGGDGIFAVPGSGGAGGGYAGFFDGNVHVNGNLSKNSGSFEIDHPLDPANKYLYHSFVESPDMMNLYNGTVMLDANGEAVVELPEWFEALNRDFRYQLTCIGGFAPVYIAEEISSNHFKIAGGNPGMKVSWQVTGIRQDAWANAHRIQVEVEKPERERGYYLHPELYGAPEEKGIEWARHPEMMKRRKEMREKPLVPPAIQPKAANAQ